MSVNVLTFGLDSNVDTRFRLDVYFILLNSESAFEIEFEKRTSVCSIWLYTKCLMAFQRRSSVRNPVRAVLGV